jgi:DNA-binding transcriptional ArsR family regulator
MFHIHLYSIVNQRLRISFFNTFIVTLQYINMGVTKAHNFTEHQNQIAKIAKVLGHPARIAIIQHVAKTNGCICGDLVLEVGLAQATISQHLKELKSIGIIQGNVEGTSVCYCIDQVKWNEIKRSLITFFSFEFPIAAQECC